MVRENSFDESVMDRSADLGELEASDVAVALLDSALTLLCANLPMARFAGRPIEELVGASLAEIVPELPAVVLEGASRVALREIGAVEHETTLNHGKERLRVHLGVYASACTTDVPDGIQLVIRPAREARDVEKKLRRRLEFEQLITEISGLLSGVPADEISRAMTGAIRRIIEHLGLDRSTLFEVVPPRDEVYTRATYSRPGIKEAPKIRTDNLFPWMWSQLRQNEIVTLSEPDQIPPDAALDRQWMELIGPCAIVVMPIHLAGRLAYLFTLESFSPVQEWPPELISRQRLAGELIGMAAARENAYLELTQRLRFEHTLRAVSSLFVNPSADQFDEDTEVALRLLVELTDVDRASVGIFSEDGSRIQIRHAYAKQGVALSRADYPRHALPWLAAQVSAGKRLHVVSPEEMPGEGFREAELMREEGIRSYLALPLRVQSNVLGFLGFAALDRESQVTDRTIDNLEIAASVMANAIARREADLALAALREDLEQENLVLKEHTASYREHAMLVGSNPKMREVVSRVAQVGPTRATVLITGETGTGKELLAEAVHAASDRSHKTMVKVNCAALPSTLIESELFGREQGAYTGAMTRQVGRFELAHGSTLFLDEIGDLSVDLQAKLLRVLQEGEFERLGSSKTIKVDVRVVAATNRDLARAVREGNFREDLYYRLRVFPIAVPPLRERMEVIPQLVWLFAKDLGRTMGKAIESIPKGDMQSLQQYSWPGNIRELRNVVEHAMIVARGKVLRLAPPAAGVNPIANVTTLDEVVAEHLFAVLERTRWRVKGPGGAAEILGLNPATLRSKMKKLGIERPED